jgi:hypothetical protein
METAFGDLPVVGTLRQCIETADRWQGVDERRGLFLPISIRRKLLH